MSLSGWEALADVQRGHNTRCVGRVSLAEREDLKGKIVWLGGSRRRPTMASAIAVSGKPRRA